MKKVNLQCMRVFMRMRMRVRVRVYAYACACARVRARVCVCVCVCVLRELIYNVFALFWLTSYGKNL